MAEVAGEIRSVIIEREMSYPPEKIWRALTQPHLIEEWLMKSDFKPVIDHRFKLSADWGAVDCQVRTIEQHKTLSYTWDAYGLESVVTWTLTPDENRNQPAHGTVRLPPRSRAGLSGCKTWLEAVHGCI